MKFRIMMRSWKSWTEVTWDTVEFFHGSSVGAELRAAELQRETGSLTKVVAMDYRTI